MIDISGVQAKKKYETLPEGDPLSSDGTTKKMRESLGANSNDFVTLNEGLRLTIQCAKDVGA